jgi:hypothetical protein
VISEKTGEVSVLSLRLKSALGDVTKLKKSKVHSQKTVAQFWSTSPATTGTTMETGIQTETETAVGATDVCQLLDVELQLGLAAVCDREKMVDRPGDPGHPRTIAGRHLHQRHVRELNAFLEKLHLNYPGNVAMRGELIHSCLCKLNGIPCHLGQWRGVVSKTGEYVL